MENRKSEIMSSVKDGAILFAITLIAGLLLGFFYQITKEPIAKQGELAIQKACAAVFKDATFEEVSYVMSDELSQSLDSQGVTIGTVYQALDAQGQSAGYVVESTSANGYGGNIVLYVGIRADKTVSGVSILSIAETPGLGMKAEDVLIPQFADKTAVAFTYSKTGSVAANEIDAISGATITTKAVVDAVNGAVNVTTELLEGGN